jgi:hypothetical protein
MILCEWDAPEGDPGKSCVHLFARILLTSFTSVSVFSVCCYSSVSISMVLYHLVFPPVNFFPRRLSGPLGIFLLVLDLGELGKNIVLDLTDKKYVFSKTFNRDISPARRGIVLYLEYQSVCPFV